MRVYDVGSAALLAELDDAVRVVPLARAFRASGLAAIDVVPGARTVLFDGVDRDAVRAWLAARRDDDREVDAEAGPVVEVEVRYDGPDLADVAELWGCGVDEVVERHSDLEHVVAFCGFSPGFPYCRGLPKEWAVPRLADPRTRVPAGSVAVADVWTGIYPTASPGGWRLLGRTDADLWRVDRDPPALLTPGTRVRFLPR